MLEAADELEAATAGTSVRCYQDCCWASYFPGGLYEPPSYDCKKEVELDALNLVPEYTESDDVDVPDCPFYLNYDRVSELYHSYIVFDSCPESVEDSLD